MSGRSMRVPLVLAILAGVALSAPAANAARARCVVPRLAGDSLAKAEQHLRAADCLAGRVVRPKIATGRLVVGSTTPAAGRRERARTRVTVRLEAATAFVMHGKVRYVASVDPSFTQDPTDPLAVTYDYSASATASNDGLSLNLQAQDALPDGVLNFYSASTPGGPEQLYCSMNVGGDVSDGSCPITYGQTGTFAVTTEYIPSGTSAVTETDQETIGAFTTTTTVAVASISCSPWAGEIPPATAADCYTLTPTVTDQNNNAATGDVLLTFTPTAGGAATISQTALVPAGTTCNVLVYGGDANQHGNIASPNCDFDIASIGGASDLFNVTAWSVTAGYQGATGWDTSTSTPLTLNGPA